MVRQHQFLVFLRFFVFESVARTRRTDRRVRLVMLPTRTAAAQTFIRLLIADVINSNLMTVKKNLNATLSSTSTLIDNLRTGAFSASSILSLVLFFVFHVLLVSNSNSHTLCSPEKEGVNKGCYKEDISI